MNLYHKLMKEKNENLEKKLEKKQHRVRNPIDVQNMALQQKRDKVDLKEQHMSIEKEMLKRQLLLDNAWRKSTCRRVQN